MSYQISSRMGEKALNLIEKIKKQIVEEYTDITKQINTMIRDISRYIVISNIKSDVFDLMKGSEDFIYRSIENPQKQLIMKQKQEIMDTLDDFLEYLYDELWDFFESQESEMEKGDNRDRKIKETEEIYWYEFIISNLAIMTGLIKSESQRKKYKKYPNKPRY